jgi:hypothetical protein
VEGAGHWVNQERAEESVREILGLVGEVESGTEAKL